ncbi:MAG: hypothetical protein E6G68_04285 [Actinobacteria bacterium]|nr:MAG: hypothetical protein E6G68_04285 [Actinomycetota bacterium]
MAFFRRLACVSLAFVSLMASPAGARMPPPSFTIIALPAAEWQRFAERHAGAFGLGVFPDSRDPLRFIEELGVGAPLGEKGERSPLAGAGGTLGRAFFEHDVLVNVLPSGPPAITRAMERAFAGERPRFDHVGRLITVGAVSSAAAAEGIIAHDSAPVAVVLGVGAQTPVWIDLCSDACRRTRTPAGVLTNGIARRPLIVTPYDLARTIFDTTVASRKKDPRFAGNDLGIKSDPHALARTRSVAASLVRDASVGHAVGGVTVPMSIAAAMIGALLLWTGRRRLAIRAALAAWAANAGYVVALFAPTRSGALRAIVVVAVMFVAAALPVRGAPRTAARYAFAVTAVFAIMAALAPLRPGGFPAVAIWGNPLASWRFFGLQNFEAGFIASGVVLWGVMSGLGPRVVAAVSLAAAVIIAGPTIGANYVGVLTFVFGAALAILALARRRVEVWHVLLSGAIAVAAFVLSLLADAGSPVSHGGRAARRISQGGISVVWEFVRARMRLNLDLIRSFPVETGFVLLVAMLLVIALLLRWGTQRGEPWPARAAVWAGAAMALSSMVLEDSGFYSGAIIFVIAAAAFIVASAEPAAREA